MISKQVLYVQKKEMVNDLATIALINGNRSVSRLSTLNSLVLRNRVRSTEYGVQSIRIRASLGKEVRALNWWFSGFGISVDSI
jgi:hypothetical protein